MLMRVERQINAARMFIGDYYLTGDNRPLFGGDRCAADIGVGALQQGGGMTMLTRAEIGALGEQLAADHLIGLGMRIVARNWRCRYGELDVIAVDPVVNTVVFVEVKTRTGDGFGGLAQAVTAQKARRLRRLAGIWLAAQDQRWAAVRIDVIGVRIGRRRTPELTHLQGVG
jgi:putative endonuclease